MPSYGMWRTDATQIEPGAIIWIRRPVDSKGRVTHDHQFVVISPTSEIRIGGILAAVAISSSLRPDQIDPARHYPLPHRRDGHPDTGLNKASWACVDWVHSVEVFEGDEFDLEIRAEFDHHFISPTDLRALIRLRDQWSAQHRPQD